MEGLGDYHTKSDRERQMHYNVTYMWNLKYGTNEPSQETETNSQTQRTDLVAKVAGGEEGTGSSGLADANSYLQNG